MGLPRFQRVLDRLFANGAGLWPTDAANRFYGNQRAWDMAGEGITKAMTKGKGRGGKPHWRYKMILPDPAFTHAEFIKIGGDQEHGILLLIKLLFGHCVWIAYKKSQLID